MGRDKPNKPRRRRNEPEDQTEGVWINSDVDPVTGLYHLSISYEGDLTWPLSYDDAWAYARVLATQLARVTHDAAAFDQLTTIGLSPEAAAALITTDLRPDRRPVDQVGRLRLEPGVTVQGKPFLALFVDDKPVGQWSVDDAREHLVALLESIETIELDDKLRQVLLHTVGVEDGIARAFVHNLHEHRQ